MLRRLRVGPFSAKESITLDNLADLVHRAALLEALLPVETALDDIPVLAVTDEDAFRLRQGRPLVLLPRQVELLKPRIGASRAVSAMTGGKLVALCELRAGQLSPTRVFHL
jgi:tRNA pseudouridine55 synthase